MNRSFERWWRPATLLIAIVAIGAIVAVVSGGGGDEGPADHATLGSAVPSRSVTPEVVRAIDTLLAEQFVTIDALGYVEGGRVESQAVIDTAGRMALRESLTTPAEVGDPRGDAAIVTEWVLNGDTLSARIIQPGEPEPPDFEQLDVSGRADELIAGGYTYGGRLFDSLAVMRRLVTEVPFEAELLGERSLDDMRVTGARLRLDAADVGRWLESSGLERVVSPRDGETVLELWWSGDHALRQFVASGVQYHDGEALDDVTATVEYRATKPSTST